MRTFLAIIIVAVLGIGAAFFFTKHNANGTGSVDGSINNDDAAAAGQAVDPTTLLDGKRHV